MQLSRFRLSFHREGPEGGVLETGMRIPWLVSPNVTPMPSRFSRLLPV